MLKNASIRIGKDTYGTFIKHLDEGKSLIKVKDIKQVVLTSEIREIPIVSYDTADIYSNLLDNYLRYPCDYIDNVEGEEEVCAIIDAAKNNEEAVAQLKAANVYSIYEAQVNKHLSDLSLEYEQAWDDAINCLQDWIDTTAAKHNWDKHFFIAGTQMGWRSRSGYTTIVTDDAEELLKRLLPNCETSFDFYDRGTHLTGSVYHHDAPTGEGRYIYFMEDKLTQELSFKDMKSIVKTVNNNYGYERHRNYRNKKELFKSVIDIVCEEGIEVTGIV